MGLAFPFFLIPLKRNSMRPSPVHNKDLSSRLKFSFWFSFAAFIHEGHVYKRVIYNELDLMTIFILDQRSDSSWTGKFVIAAWSLIAFVFTAGYAGVLFSFFGNPLKEIPIDTLQQLEDAVRNRGWSFGTLKGSAIEAMFKVSKYCTYIHRLKI